MLVVSRLLILNGLQSACHSDQTPRKMWERKCVRGNQIKIAKPATDLTVLSIKPLFSRRVGTIHRLTMREPKMSTARRLISSFLVGAGSLALATAVLGQSGTSVYEGDWPEYHGDHFAQRYSPLDQINAENVGDLEIAWQFSTQNFGPSTDFNNPSTPIEIDDSLLVTVSPVSDAATLSLIHI